MATASLTALAQAQAVRALLAQLGAGPQQGLLALAGQSLDAVFQGMGAQGAELLLPDGQLLVAQGELPFAQGTRLTIQVLSESGGTVRLQVQAAQPPASPAVLQPLLAGEAQPLLARMAAGGADDSLLPLARMLAQVLETAGDVTISPSPSAAQWDEAAAALPQEIAQPLRQALGLSEQQPLGLALKAWIEAPVSGAGALPSLAEAFAGQVGQVSGMPEGEQEALMAWMQGLLAKAGGASSFLALALPEAVESLSDKSAAFLRQVLGIPEDLPLAQGVKGWMDAVLARNQGAGAWTGRGLQAPVPRFEALLRSVPDLSDALRAEAGSWFQALLEKAGGEAPAARPRADAAFQSSSASSETPLGSAEEGKSDAVSKPPLEDPIFWNKWVRGTVEALADPKVSPREAPFHALQAQDGTAYFELPAPWLPHGVVQLWVESDASRGGPPEEGTRRVFMGFQLSNLGDTRLGLELTGANLRVRIWSERPERLAALRDSLARELEGTGRTVSLRILPLTDGTASLRSMVTGNSWQGMG